MNKKELTLNRLLEGCDITSSDDRRKLARILVDYCFKLDIHKRAYKPFIIPLENARSVDRIASLLTLQKYADFGNTITGRLNEQSYAHLQCILACVRGDILGYRAYFSISMERNLNSLLE